MDECLLARGLAAQVLLRERRSLVGPLRLRPDEHDRAVEAILPELRSRAGSGQARPHDDEWSLAHDVSFAKR
jgi:hypothetical protein